VRHHALCDDADPGVECFEGLPVAQAVSDHHQVHIADYVVDALTGRLAQNGACGSNQLGRSIEEPVFKVVVTGQGSEAVGELVRR
jgi:hypothetical protein